VDHIILAYLSLSHVSSSSKITISIAWLNVFDFLAILPFYIALIIGQSKAQSLIAIRVLRLTRTFKLLKLSRYMNRLIILKQVMLESKQILSTFSFIVSIGIVIFSSAMYLAERGIFDDAS
jgi:hypothetical protein